MERTGVFLSKRDITVSASPNPALFSGGASPIDQSPAFVSIAPGGSCGEK